MPRTVWGELVQAGTRPGVVAGLEAAAWIEVVEDPPVQDLGLDAGETAAILLAEQLGADALLIDARTSTKAGWFTDYLLHDTM